MKEAKKKKKTKLIEPVNKVGTYFFVNVQITGHVMSFSSPFHKFDGFKAFQAKMGVGKL